jgi:homogentisate 1,2-dioxygenase
MLLLDVIYDGRMYSLPNIPYENHKPQLQAIRKKMATLFKPFFDAYPNDDVMVFWNDDYRELKYNSQTINSNTIKSLICLNIDKFFG